MDFLEDLDEEELAEHEGEEHDPAKINYGRPLQPAQQKDDLTSEPNAYWALMVGSFKECAKAVDRQVTCVHLRLQHATLLDTSGSACFSHD
jgi:hypothetical protein